VGTDDTPPPKGPTYPTEQSFCTAAAEAVCNANVVAACYQTTDVAASTESCRAEYALRENCNPAGLPYRHEGSEAHLELLRAMYGDAQVRRVELEAVTESALTVFSNSGHLNDSCTVDTDCSGVDGLRCVVKPGIEGTCQQPVEVTAGNRCDEPNEVCADDFFCDSGGTDPSNACIAYPDVGDACSETTPCADDALCVTPTGGTAACQAKTANGGACQGDEQCEGGFCVRPTGATDGTCGDVVVLSPTTAGSCAPFLASQ
jgi:hypothetical protein